MVAKHRDVVLDAIRSGMRLTDVAASLGLKTHGAITNSFRDDPEYLTAREIGAESKMEIRERELEAAEDSVAVARARELLSHARWRAEREHPTRWGQRQQVEHGAQIVVNIAPPEAVTGQAVRVELPAIEADGK